jgi:hypothetical protein
MRVLDDEMLRRLQDEVSLMGIVAGANAGAAARAAQQAAGGNDCTKRPKVPRNQVIDAEQSVTGAPKRKFSSDDVGGRFEACFRMP